MPDFKLPLSGNVAQTINPWTLFLSGTGNQVGLLNINLGNSSNPAIEDQVLSDVASYGKQLGRIEDALLVLMEHFRPERALTKTEDESLRDLRRMVEDIANVKRRHNGHPAVPR